MKVLTLKKDTDKSTFLLSLFVIFFQLSVTILLLFVLAIAASGATFYVVKTKSNTQPSNRVSNQVDSVSAQVQPQVQVVAAPPDPEVPQTPVQAPTPTPTPTPAPKQKPASAPAPVLRNSQAKTYKEILSYSAPDDYVETITVTIILNQSGSIVDILFAYSTPDNRQSAEYLQSFAKDFKKSLLVGQPIASAHISRIGGASLTTLAFNTILTTVSFKSKL